MRDLTTYKPQIKRISKKLADLKNIDKSFEIFGSSTHKYKLSKPISIEKLEKIEQKYRISLPDEYVAFVTLLGNGGAGPYYGLGEVESSISWSKSGVDINKQTMLVSNECVKEFLIKCAIMAYEDDDESYGKIDETYKASNIYNGTISIASGGCDIDIRLIINGCNSGKRIIVLWDSLDLIEDLANNEDLFNNYFERNLNLDKMLINLKSYLIEI